jgi:hypothetical protein
VEKPKGVVAWKTTAEIVEEARALRAQEIAEGRYYVTPGGLHLGWSEPDPHELQRQEAEYLRRGERSLRFPGDWIRYGRVPLELLDELNPTKRRTDEGQEHIHHL